MVRQKEYCKQCKEEIEKYINCDMAITERTCITERRTMNHEGYQDPTADKAVRRYNQMPYHMRRALTDLQDIASLFGFDIITIKDRRTGRKYRVEEKTNQ